MKGMIAFLVIGALVVIGLGWWYAIGMSKPPTITIPMAISPAKSDIVEMNAAVGMAMTRVDPPLKKANGRYESWDDWLNAHFTLRDELKNPVRIRRNNFSQLIAENQVGSPEFYIVAELTPGVKYTFEYMPYRTGGEIHRYEFTAPPEGMEFARVRLDLVD